MKCFHHQLRGMSDSVESPEPAALYHIDKIPASGKPGCFLSDRKEFSGMLPWPHSHLRADSRNQHEFRVILLQPEKYFCTPEEAEVAGYEPPILFREDNLEQVDKQRYAP